MLKLLIIIKGKYPERNEGQDGKKMKGAIPQKRRLTRQQRR